VGVQQVKIQRKAQVFLTVYGIEPAENQTHDIPQKEADPLEIPFVNDNKKYLTNNFLKTTT
jgi:hypothetical protein